MIAGCAAPLNSPGKTAQIEFVSTATTGGYKFDYYRNLAYPCSISGYQTFVIGTKVGSSATDTRPLWVHMHGGGVGWFNSAGEPQPGPGQKVEEAASGLINRLRDNGVIGRARNDAVGFRFVAVSMCNHDIYAGGDQLDPNNPNKTPDGKPRTTNGMFATKAAIAYAKHAVPDRQGDPPRRQRRLRGRLQRLVLDAEGGRAAGRRDRRLRRGQHALGAGVRRLRASAPTRAVTRRRSRRSPRGCIPSWQRPATSRTS